MNSGNKDNEKYAIKVSGVKKQYRLGQIGGGTLTADLQSWWARVRGKEDPNMKIDQDQRLIGQTFMALNGIDLTINQGEAVGIIGHNGAGKSTLLKLLSRVTAPTAGTIDINGRIASMLEVGTGFHQEMTGRENVYLNGAILGMTKSEIDAKMEKIIEFSEVGDFIDTPVKRYSSGMYVKLAFSVAAHLDSEIMIMDEVLAVGDMAFQKKCIDKMREAAHQEGRTVLYVSHNMNTIRQLCERCIVLDQGKVVYDGDVEEAISTYLNSRVVTQTKVELLDIKRDVEFMPHPITMTSLEVLNVKEPIIQTGERLSCKICFKSAKVLENVFVRIILKTAESSPITMMSTDAGFNTDASEHEITFTLDTSHLVPGNYTISPVFYLVNEFGGTTNLDGLKDIYGFKIVAANDFNKNMVWQPRFWGHFFSKPLQYHID